ncbi:MAG TPA: YCF48-related protein [Xanthomonadales bacterium]|nr:YCF48-related protein [Xanthomonadales bacterium]
MNFGNIKQWGLLSALLAVPFLLCAQESVQTQDIEYAELKRLATGSLLLDVTRRPDGSLVAVGERGHVILSDDGEDWRQAEVVPTRSTLTAVTSVGDRLWAAGHDTVIITSGDGGLTWTRQYFDPERLQAVMDIHFTDESNGVAMGAYGLYLVTEDGGENWEDESVDYENEYHLNSLILFEDGRRMIAGEAGFSYRSFDDGMTWEPLDLPYQGSMWGAQKSADDCILFFGLRGHILESCDFGDTWEELNAATMTSLSAAAEHQGRTVIVGNSGVILIRNESGEFSVYTHSSGVDFASIVSLDDGDFLLVGEDGVHRFPENSGTADQEGTPP